MSDNAELVKARLIAKISEMRKIKTEIMGLIQKEHRIQGELLTELESFIITQAMDDYQDEVSGSVEARIHELQNPNSDRP